jgi:hypothetical protein
MMAGTVSDFFEQSVSGHTNSGSQSASKSDSGIGQKFGPGPQSPPWKDSIGVERTESQKSLRENAVFQDIDYEDHDERHLPRASSSSHYGNDALSIHMLNPEGNRW